MAPVARRPPAPKAPKDARFAPVGPRILLASAFALLAAVNAGVSQRPAASPRTPAGADPIAPDIRARLAQLPATKIDYDRKLLDEKETRALQELIETKGTQHDPWLVDAFVTAYKEGRVIEQARRPIRPTAVDISHL